MKFKVPYYSWERIGWQAIPKTLPQCKFWNGDEPPDPPPEIAIVWNHEKHKKVVWKEVGILEWIRWQWRKMFDGEQFLEV